MLPPSTLSTLTSSQALRIPYASIVNKDPFDILTLILSKNVPERHGLAGQFVKAACLEPHLVSDYVREWGYLSVNVLA